MGGRASAKSKNHWNAQNYDRINLMLPKGMKERIRILAEARGESVNGFIKRAIEARLVMDCPSDDEQSNEW